ncbi:MAG: lipopolysaccharide heptosyltransferase II [Verrucomicrobiia bacterium]
MRILVIKPSSLGDVVHALPAVSLIRRRFPDAHISWLINDSLVSLLKNCPIINQTIAFPRHDWAKLPRLARQLRQGRFDLVVDLQGLLRSGLMTWTTRASRRIGLSDAREGARWFYNEVVKVPRAHAVERYLCAARHLGCGDGPIEFPLGIASPQREGLIAVNPSARWKTKLWGDDKFAELVRHLPRERVVLTGSATEREQVEKIAQGCRNLAGQTDLFELAELYARCAVVITNDSGPMHIAAAVGTPVVAIFGPTDPALTGPYGKQHVVLRAGIPCSPCMKDHCTHTPRMECMTLVTVEQVLAAVKAFL